jgi:hypothetical protein
MTHKVLNTERRVHLRQTGRHHKPPTTLTQLNAEYVSSINRVLEQGRDDLARELAAAFDADQRRIAGQP